MASALKYLFAQRSVPQKNRAGVPGSHMGPGNHSCPRLEYHIPPGLMTTGNYNISDLVTQFLTFVVDPTADMISKTLTAAYGKDEFIKGNYYRVDTSKIKHFDIFGMASDVDKLISSGFASVNEVRRAADWDPAGDPEDADNWLNQHILTKNYEKEGGETTT